MVAEEASFMPAVLVVEANASHRVLYQMEMEARGFNVVCARNGHEALEKIQQRRFDVAVVEVILPDFKDTEFLKKFSASCQNLPIIINTSYPYGKSRIRKWAADAFVTKSSDLNELFGKMNSLARSSRLPR